MKKIHLIMKTHLDLGFTDYAENIERIYRDKFIPDAIQLAKELNTEKKIFIWTTGAWIIENALKYSSSDNRAELDLAIKRGDIVPHGLAFTTHSELLDEDTYRYGLEIAKKLAEKYQLNIISAKMTDVPGHTKAIVPLLAEYGIKMLHIGVNEGSAMPELPQAFVWKVDGSEVIVVYEGTYGSLYKNEFIDDILCFCHSSDNHGPNSKKNIINTYKKLHKLYPDYEISASTLDEYAKVLWEVKDKLPVITSGIGDSWIHGAASDPYKVGAMRELIMMKNEWLKAGSLMRGGNEYNSICNYILEISEHTWGMDVKRHLSDTGIYLKKDFIRARAKDRVKVKYDSLKGISYKFIISAQRLIGIYKKGYYSKVEKSWQEQRNYIKSAIEAMTPEHRSEAVTRIGKLIPETGFQINNCKAAAINKQYVVGDYSISFNEFGAISELKYGKENLINKHNRSVIDYKSYSSKDYDFWLNNYSRNLEKTRIWVIGDFARPLLNLYDSKFPQGVFQYNLMKLYQSEDNDYKYFLSKLSVNDDLSEELGAPRIYEILYSLDKHSFRIKEEVIWINKDASRLSEAAFLHFYFNFDKDSLRYRKIGRLINPYDIVPNGNRNLSAVEAIEFKINNKDYIIKNYHSPLVALGKGKILKFDNHYEDIITDGISFNLHNNVWGTNFPLWYSDNAYFAFELKLK